MLEFSEKLHCVAHNKAATQRQRPSLSQAAWHGMANVLEPNGKLANGWVAWQAFIAVEGLATRHYLTLTRIPMIDFKQNVELPILTNYFLNAAVLWFSPHAETVTIKKTPASRRRFRCIQPSASVREQGNQDDDRDGDTNHPQKDRAHRVLRK